MQSFRSIHIIKGKPGLSAQLIAALVLRAGHSYHVTTLTDTRCELMFTRSNSEKYIHAFTIEDAKQAGLAGGDNWRKYPKAMLFSRCMSAGARVVMPDAITNLYTAEELGANVAIDEETGEIVPVVEGEITETLEDVTPIPYSQPKASEPAQPETVRGWLIAKADKYGGQEPPSPQAAGLMVGKLEEAHKDHEQARKLFTSYVFGKVSSKEMFGCEVRAVLFWLLTGKDAHTGDYTLNSTAVQEYAMIVRQARRDSGQSEMLTEDLYGKED